MFLSTVMVLLPDPDCWFSRWRARGYATVFFFPATIYAANDLVAVTQVPRPAMRFY
jgi:hypothetical protein